MATEVTKASPPGLITPAIVHFATTTTCPTLNLEDPEKTCRVEVTVSSCHIVEDFSLREQERRMLVIDVLAYRSSPISKSTYERKVLFAKRERSFQHDGLLFAGTDLVDFPNFV